MKNNLIATPLKRILAILIDVMIILLIAIPLSLIAIEKKSNELLINREMYYVWFSIFVVLLIIHFYLIPYITKGSTIGELIFKIKIVWLDEKIKSNSLLLIFKKNSYGPFLWILILISFIAFVPPQTAEKLMIKDVEEEKIKFSLLEYAGISIPAILSPVTIFINVFYMATIGMAKNNMGIFDKIYNIGFVFNNRFIKNTEINENKLLPEETKKPKIIWKE